MSNRRIDLEAIYQALPIPLQNLATSLEGWRLNRRRYDQEFMRLYADSNARQFLAGDSLLDYQTVRLKNFLQQAASAPFWKERFTRYGVDTFSDNPLSEIGKLPILSKQEVKDNAHLIRPTGLEREGLLSCHTSGTTGSGLIFYETRQAEKERWANWWRYRSWHGISRDSSCGYFGGRSLVPLGQKQAPFWRMNKPGRQLMFSGYHLKPETAASYIGAIKHHRIKWIHGYPSIISLLAGYVLDQNLDTGKTLQKITFGAESLLPQQRQLIEKAFGVPTFQHYGQAESVANISECEEGRLHVDEDFSLVEFVPLPGYDDAHRIIGTNWTNPAFPLIRYDVGDIATLAPEACTCGRPGRIVAAIDGRREDFIILPDGTSIGRLDHIFKDLVNIREAQLYQNNADSIVIRVVKGTSYSRSDELMLFSEARKRLGGDIKIHVEYLENLQKSRAGKLRFVVSDVKPQQIQPTI